MALSFRIVLAQRAGLVFALGLAAGLALTGCGNKETGAAETAGDNPVTAAADAQVAAIDPMQDDTGTNEPPAIAYGLAQRLQDSPFASADPGLKETFARALIAYDIGDYERALSEINDLQNGGGLDAQQTKAVKELLARTAKAAPELARSNALAAAAITLQPEIFPLAAEGAPPFSTADPSVKESYARAKTAFDIGNYDVALSELRELVTNAQLNVPQRYAVQTLLDKTPRPVPGTSR